MAPGRVAARHQPHRHRSHRSPERHHSQLSPHYGSPHYGSDPKVTPRTEALDMLLHAIPEKDHAGDAPRRNAMLWDRPVCFEELKVGAKVGMKPHGAPDWAGVYRGEVMEKHHDGAIIRWNTESSDPRKSGPPVDMGISEEVKYSTEWLDSTESQLTAYDFPLHRLWRYAGLSGKPEEATTRHALDEFNRTKMAKDLHHHRPVAADYNLRANACCCLTGVSTFRKMMIKAVDTKMFDNIVLFTIAANTIVMALQNDSLDFLDDIFSILFTVEMFMKIFARGFLMHQGAYLKNSWNIMDFIIVCSGYVTKVLEAMGASGQNLTVLRLLRVIRPLRAVSRIRGLRVIMQTVARAMPVLKDVLLLLCFILVVYAVVGMQMWGGLHHQRCYATLAPEVAELAPRDGACTNATSLTAQFCTQNTNQFGDICQSGHNSSDGNQYLCDSNSIQQAQINRSLDNLTSPLVLSKLVLIQNVSFGCSMGSSSGTQCTEPNTEMMAWTNGSIYGIPQKCAVDESQFFKGIMNFDNIIASLLLCFKVLSLDDWPVDMKEIQDAQGIQSAMFFISLTLLGNYFTVNLVLAVLSTVFSDERTSSDNNPDSLGMKMEGAAIPMMGLTPGNAVGGCMILQALTVMAPKLIHPCPEGEEEEEEDDGNQDDDDDDGVDANLGGGGEGGGGGALQSLARNPTGATAPYLAEDDVANYRTAHMVGRATPPPADEGSEATQSVSAVGSPPEQYQPEQEPEQPPSPPKPPGPPKKEKPNNCCTRLVREGQGYTRAKVFGAIMTIATIINVLAMAVDHKGISPGLEDILEYVNQACSVIFLIEACIKIPGLGCEDYFNDPFNAFDFFLVAISVLELLISLAQGGSGGGSSFSALRAFRLMRVFRLAGKFPSLRKLLETIVHSVGSVTYLGMLMCIFVFIYAMFGLNLFGEKGDSGEFPNIRANFRNLGHACVTVFIVITGEGWATIMVEIMEEFDQGKWAAAVYFISLFILGNYLLINLFIAILIDSFSAQRAEQEEAEALEDETLEKSRPGPSATISETFQMMLDGRAVVQVQKGLTSEGSTTRSKIRKKWVVTEMCGEKVRTAADIESAFERNIDAKCVLKASHVVPYVKVVGARDSNGEENFGMNGEYMLRGEVDGQPMFQKNYVYECCNMFRKSVKCSIEYSLQERCWVMRGPGFYLTNPQAGDCLACPRVPSKFWPEHMTVRRWSPLDMGDFEEAAEYDEHRPPMARRICVFDGMITRNGVDPFLFFDYKPQLRIATLKRYINRKLAPLRYIPPTYQHIRIAAAGNGSKEFRDTVSFGAIYEASDRVRSMPHITGMKGWEHLRLWTHDDDGCRILKTSRFPAVEECLQLDYTIDGAQVVTLLCYGSSVTMAIERPYPQDAPADQDIEMKRALARRLRLDSRRQALYMRVVDRDGRQVALDYETMRAYREQVKSGVRTPAWCSFVVHVLPTPAIEGERVRLIPPGWSQECLAEVISDNPEYDDDEEGVWKVNSGTVTVKVFPVQEAPPIVSHSVEVGMKVAVIPEGKDHRFRGKVAEIGPDYIGMQWYGPVARYETKLSARVQKSWWDTGGRAVIGWAPYSEDISRDYWETRANVTYENRIDISFSEGPDPKVQYSPSPQKVTLSERYNDWFMRVPADLRFPPVWRSDTRQHPEASVLRHADSLSALTYNIDGDLSHRNFDESNPNTARSVDMEDSTQATSHAPYGDIGAASEPDFHSQGEKWEGEGVDDSCSESDDDGGLSPTARKMLNVQKDTPLQEIPFTFLHLLPSKPNPFISALFNTLTRAKSRARQHKDVLKTLISGRSLGCCGQENSIRTALFRIEQHVAFDYSIIFLIAVNTLFIAVDRPGIKDERPQLAAVLQIGDFVFTACFCMEAFIRSIVHGFWYGETAYMKSKWNRFDFLIAMISVMGIFLDAVKPARALRAIRLLLRLPGTMGPEQRLTISALGKAVPLLVDVVVVSGLITLIFSILGVQMYKGAFGVCSDASVENYADCVNQTNMSSEGAFGEEWSVAEREWTWQGFSFDNVGSATRTLAWVALGETWASIMFVAMDTQGEDQGPKTDGSPIGAVYFIFFVIVGQFFLLNLFVGVLIDGFQKEKAEAEGSNLLTPEQEEYNSLERLILRHELTSKPPVPSGCFGLRELCAVIVSSKTRTGESKFEMLVTVMILLNTAALMTVHNNQEDFWTELQGWADWLFIFLFTLEMVMKIMATSVARYADDPWNRFDMLVVVVSWLGKLLDNSTLKIMRIARFIRLINISPGLQLLFLTVMQSMGQLVNVTVFLIAVLFMFAVFGVQLCGSVKHSHSGMHDYQNFDDVGHALVTLYTIATTEGWLDIMEGCKAQPPDCDEAEGNCGYNEYLVEIYFSVFMIVVALVTINLFITVLLENFNEVGREPQLQKKLVRLLGNAKEGPGGCEVGVSFREMWLDEDPNATGFIPCDKFLGLVRTLDYPFWCKAHMYGRRDLSELVQLRRLPIPVTREGKVRWNDCVCALGLCLPGKGVTQREGVTVHREVRGMRAHREMRRVVLSIHHWFAVQLIQKHFTLKKRYEHTNLLWRKVVEVKKHVGMMVDVQPGIAVQDEAAVDRRIEILEAEIGALKKGKAAMREGRERERAERRAAGAAAPPPAPPDEEEEEDVSMLPAAKHKKAATNPLLPAMVGNGPGKRRLPRYLGGAPNW